MGQIEKKEWNRKKVVLYTGLALGIIIALLILLRLTLGVNFLLGEEIVIHLDSPQTSLVLHHGEQKNITIGFFVESPAFCRAKCSYSFIDKSKQIELDSANLTLLLGQNVERTY